MIWLALSIVSSVAIIIAFKFFERYDVNLLQTIVVNYFTCVIIGLFFIKPPTNIALTDAADWWWLAFLMGGLFIGLFNLIGFATQKIGVSVASVSTKLAVVVPVVLSFMFYQEPFSWGKVAALLIAVMAVVLSAYKPKKNTAQNLSPIMGIVLPLIIFFGSGIADSIVQYTKHIFFSNGGQELFVISLFATASILGSLIILVRSFNTKRVKLELKNVLAGVVLGIPNYFSIYCLFEALIALGNWGDSVIFPVNNIGIVLVSTVLAIVIFTEKLNKWNYLGLGLAILTLICFGLVID